MLLGARSRRSRPRTRGAAAAILSTQMLVSIAILIVAVAILFFAPDALLQPTLFAGLGLVFVLTGAAAIVPWDRISRNWRVLMPVLNILAITAIRAAEPQLGAGLMLVFPVIWLARSFPMRDVTIGTGLSIGLIWMTRALQPTPLVVNDFASVVLLPIALGFVATVVYDSARRGRAQSVLLLQHSQLIENALERVRMQQRELEARLAPLRGALENPYPGAVLGNPQGAVTLVEFSDYACPYCRISLPEVEALIAANKDLRVVMREEAVLSPESDDAAYMALAAADQGRYPAFHRAMFSQDHLSPETIEAAARAAGLDLAKAKAAIASGKYASEVENNGRMADAVGFSGTPAWVIGSEAFSGAMGRDALSQAIERARGGQP